MAVKILRDVSPYDSSMCAFRSYMEGQIVDGPEGVWLADNCPADVEVLDVEVEDQPEQSPPVEGGDPDVPNSDPDPVLGGETPAGDSADDAPAAFDPADHNGPDVIAYAKANPDQAKAIEVAERAGKARTTVLSALADLIG